MILIEAGTHSTKSFHAKLQFAQQLAALGYAVCLDQTTAPENMSRALKYQAISLLADTQSIDISRVLLLAAQDVSDGCLKSLRDFDGGKGSNITAIGRFENLQEKISTQSKLAYAMGREPMIVDLAILQPKPLLKGALTPLFASNPPKVSKGIGNLQLFVYVSKDLLEQPMALPMLDVLSRTQGVECHVLTEDSGKDIIKKSNFAHLSVYGCAEFSSTTLAQLTDVLAVFGTDIPEERVAGFALDLLRQEGIVVDCTKDASFAASGAPVVRGPTNLESLKPFLENIVFPRQATLNDEIGSHAWLQESQVEVLEQALGLSREQFSLPTTENKRGDRTIFIPTNGVGLGHAQRCSIIASGMNKEVEVGFAAFPSCIPMLQTKNFNCISLVQKSDIHENPYDNDLLNYRRLSQLFGPGDRLVFDGGYVFDSVYRTVIEQQLSAIWIRRGLWQPGQLSQTPMDREKIFDRVIVPGEAFDELNTNYSFGTHIHNVGPIVQNKPMNSQDRPDLRSRLKKQFNSSFKTLVITMLGGGVAADRSAQIQSLCAQLESRPNCLHLVVVWPNAKISPDLYAWTNSHVVKTQRALEFCLVSDLVVSAVGYNSFHEVMYHQIPTIFIPQIAGYMDDQERRARAASDRNVAATVLPHELLLLRREVDAFLDDGKAGEIRRNLTALSLPAMGAADAARLIEQEDLS